jgi:ubiquinone/menaquinone biosynthesis C-methylase UbiE
VADVEQLPCADCSVDIVYVHDGLHHLSDPLVGLAEMCRVARRCVLITEPSRAAVTAIAVRLGIALDEEDAGNRVERVSAEQVSACLDEYGLTWSGLIVTRCTTSTSLGRGCGSSPAGEPCPSLGWRFGPSTLFSDRWATS